MAGHICVIQTSFSNKDDIKEHILALDKSIRVSFLVDDTLITEVMTAGHPTPSVYSRMCKYAMAAEEMGADLILNQCSSVGEVADVYAKLVSIPVVKIDQAMAEAVVGIGGRISLIATVASTVGPSRRLIESVAREKGKRVEVKECLVDGAMAVLFSGDAKKHNEMLRGVIEAEDGKCDAIVMAQGSMMVLLPELAHIKTPLFASIPTGTRYAVEKLKERIK